MYRKDKFCKDIHLLKGVVDLNLGTLTLTLVYLVTIHYSYHLFF
jgi:hypothetical protein